MKNKHLSEIVYILDRSGSMKGMEEPAVEAFNRFVKDQQAVGGDANFTLVLFDTEFDKPVDAVPIGKVTEMLAKHFQPRGATALLDAIGLSIKATRRRLKTMAEEDTPGNVIFVIFTDGEENSSQRYDWEQISRKITKRTKKDGWEFLFLAANQDAIATASKMSISATNSASVKFTGAGVSSQGAVFSRKTTALRERAAGTLKNHGDLHASMEALVEDEQEKESDP